MAQTSASGIKDEFKWAGELTITNFEDAFRTKDSSSRKWGAKIQENFFLKLPPVCGGNQRVLQQDRALVLCAAGGLPILRPGTGWSGNS